MPTLNSLVTEDDLDFLMPLPLPPERWDYRYVPPSLVLCGSGDGSQGLWCARQALCQPNYVVRFHDIHSF